MAPWAALTAEDVVNLLGLNPHPEGGFYRETFRDTASAKADVFHFASPEARRSASPEARRSASPEARRSASPEARRSASTAIYFLLPAGVVSRWHRVDAAEVWHWYAGASLRLSVVDDGTEEGSSIVLGCNLVSGERPQAVVRVGQWQQAQSLGDWTLVGCTVAPGFEFAGFEIAASGWSPRRS